ncbi:MAG: AprI/Inh family metalloprotease inhibitor [Proteobacteria bacterium]|nr:AprI/Inh family metalloprotease inhibitor [Pseudomonadota bacterium]
MRALAAAMFVAAACAPPGARAQQPPPGETARAIAGVWELSDSDRERTCSVTFKLDQTAPGFYIAELEPKCAEVFPPIGGITSWSLGRRDALILSDAGGQPLIEMIEVEAGTFEGLRPDEGRYVLQNAAVVAASRDKTADQMFGEWTFVAGGKSVCGVNFMPTAADADSFALTLAPGCQPPRRPRGRWIAVSLW